MTASYSSLDLVFMGPPGSGKGTQARILAQRYHISHVATGDLLRGELWYGTALGAEVEPAVARGDLVSDRLLAGVLLRHIHRLSSARGFLLDGYPRNVEQALFLDDVLAERGRAIERVVVFSLPDEVVLRRLGGRLIHPGSGRIYHQDLVPPREEGRDDVSGEQLERRIDDSEEVVLRRLSIYREHTAPVEEFYRRRGLVIDIDGSQSLELVSDAVMQVVGAPVGA
jgi:adenylate kinase